MSVCCRGDNIAVSSSCSLSLNPVIRRCQDAEMSVCRGNAAGRVRLQDWIHQRGSINENNYRRRLSGKLSLIWIHFFFFFLMFLSVMFAVVLADDSLLLSSRRDYFSNGLFTVREVWGGRAETLRAAYHPENATTKLLFQSSQEQSSWVT